MIMTNIKKNFSFILLVFLLLSLSFFLFIKARNFKAENEQLRTEVFKLYSEYLKINSTIDHELPSKIEEVRSDIAIIESKFPSLEKELAEKTAVLSGLKAENDILSSQLQKIKDEVSVVYSLKKQILVDDRITDSTLVDFLVDFWTTKNEGAFEEFKKMWHIDSENSSSIDLTIKYWIKNSNFRLKKIHYQNPYSDDKNKFVVSIESHEGNYTMIVGNNYDGEWKVTMMD